MARASSGRAFPAWLWIPAGIAFLLVLGPMAALVANIPWPQARELLGTEEAHEALALSLKTSCTSTVLCLLLGLPLSLALSRLSSAARDGRGTGSLGGVLRRAGGLASTLMSLVVYAPLVLSPVVSGLALLFLWGRNAWLGGLLEQWGLSVAFTPAAVVVVQVFVAMPFFVATTVTALQAVPAAHLEIAATEGATRGETLRKVVLPAIAPALLTAMLLSFARALGEFGATVTFAGNIEGLTRTVPLNLELALDSNDVDAALGGCIMLLALYLVVVGLLGAARAVARLRQGRA